MKQRPILFSAPMVCTLLDGSKTQTRRVVSEKINIRAGMPEPEWQSLLACCPHGQVGDQLWVRETFCDATDGLHGRVLYRATGDTACKWKPSIFMPRAASRITLEITSVRVERLQDISETDALEEGIVSAGDGNGFQLADTTHYSNDQRESYASLWESLNGEGSWDLNPWVWVIEFKKAKP
jgi:hypothetical protein